MNKNYNNNNNNILMQPKTDTAKKKPDTSIINNNNNNNNNNKLYETDEGEFLMSEDDADRSLTPPPSQKAKEVAEDSGNRARPENDAKANQDVLNSGDLNSTLLEENGLNRRQNGTTTRSKKRMHQKAETEENETCQETSECIGCDTSQNKKKRKTAATTQENLNGSGEKCGNCQTMQKCMRNMMRTVEMMMNFTN